MTIFWCIVHSKYIVSAHISLVYLLMSFAQNPSHTTTLGKSGSNSGTNQKCLPGLRNLFFVDFIPSVGSRSFLKILLKILTLLETIFPKVFFHNWTVYQHSYFIGKNALNSKIVQFAKENKKTSTYNFCVALLVRKIINKN